MITRRETLNEISTLFHNGYSYANIAKALNIAVGDVKAAITAWKL